MLEHSWKISISVFVNANYSKQSRNRKTEPLTSKSRDVILINGDQMTDKE